MKIVCSTQVVSVIVCKYINICVSRVRGTGYFFTLERSPLISIKYVLINYQKN